MYKSLNRVEKFKGLGADVGVITKLNVCLGVFDCELTSSYCVSPCSKQLINNKLL
jgi:hypothetical protein